LSWFQKLHETYDLCTGLERFKALPPPCARPQDTQICITLNRLGNLRRAELSVNPETPILVTEASAVRSGRSPASNPLSDKLEYCAGDGATYGLNPAYFERYLSQLTQWCDSPYCDSKARAVLDYILQRRLIADLLEQRVLALIDGQLQRIKPGGYLMDAGDAWIRWCVEIPGEDLTNTWDDHATFALWEKFESSNVDSNGLCMASGSIGRIGRIHPKGIRGGRDQAKLISSNDTDGFTFRGRFIDAEQAASVGYIASQKAHNALRWLIARQGYRPPMSNQVVVAWAVAGQQLPPVIAGSDDLLDSANDSETPLEPYEGDAGQLFAKRLNKRISGYSAQLADRDDIVVMALDSATPGRMAITYYRELSGSEFLERIQKWHEKMAWPQNMGKGRHFIGAPAPRDIAEVTYGRLMKGKLRVDEKLAKGVIERLLPCIVDQRPIPHDLVQSCARRAMNRVAYGEGQEYWEWERTLGIACALVRGSRREKEYSMSLEEQRTTRDYLFGRLLAVAEKIEGYALYLQGEKRDTTAERLMQRFSDHPASTWRTIELALVPYMARLRSSRGPALHVWKTQLDEIAAKFQGDDFTRPGRLDAEFLLGYHCQRAALNAKRTVDSGDGQADATNDTTHQQGDL
jgi:CRISPR-associated protein Csd1